jgi:hypothetical protein
VSGQDFYWFFDQWKTHLRRQPKGDEFGAFYEECGICKEAGSSMASGGADQSLQRACPASQRLWNFKHQLSNGLLEAQGLKWR